MTQIDQRIDALFGALPATQYSEIAETMTSVLKETITESMVAQLLVHLRVNMDYYGWTVPHVKRGPAGEGGDDKGRLFAVLVDKDGTFYFDEAHRAHFDAGALSTMMTVARQAKNLSNSLGVAKQYERSRARRDAMQDLNDDVDYLAKRANRMVREMK